MRHIEFETKALLNKDDYLKLFNLYKTDQKKYEQTNIYLDNKSREILKDKRLLRIRIKSKIIELTLKTPLKSGIEELNQNISNAEMNNILLTNNLVEGEIKKRLQATLDNDIKVKEIARLKTTRLDFNYKGALISLDKNEYNNQIDYEIEVEASDMKKSHLILNAILCENKISFKENLISKSERAISSHI